VLTSGQQPSAEQGVPLLRQLAESSTAVRVMPGGGVRAHNVARILQDTGTAEVHFSARRDTRRQTPFRRPEVRLSSPTWDLAPDLARRASAGDVAGICRAARRVCDPRDHQP
jgi:copper homeostasis protein CutC